MSSDSRSILLLGALSGVFAVGFISGRWSADDPSPQQDEDVAAEATVTPAQLERPETSFIPAAPRSTTARPRSAPHTSGPQTGPKAGVRPSAHPLHGHPENPDFSADPEDLAKTLRDFESSTDGTKLPLWTAELMQARDPEVEQLALRLARTHPDPKRRVAAFDILDAHDSPLALPVVLAALGSESDVEVRRAAIHALPPASGANTDDARQVVAQLTASMKDADPELRRRAAIRLARWHTSPADLGPILTALERDPSVDVRAGCAFACQSGALRYPEVMSALTRVLRSSGEDALVKENAWKALGSLGPLPPEVHQVWTETRKEYEARLEAEGDW